ncbi:MAG: gliding motility-associated C-terminal domain-containing protein [Pricia sp.]
MKARLFYSAPTFLIAFLLLTAAQVSAQTIAFTDPPMPAANQNNGSTNVWPRACASSAFNDYFVTINWVGTANADNEFILELSNNTGSFASPVELDRVGDQNTNFEFFMNFVLPTDTRGAGYKMRVRSTSPAATSAASDAYAMYYLSFNSNLHISPNGDGTTPGSVQACDGTPVTLTVDNLPPSTINTYQYAWYRSGTKLSENGPSIETDGTGDYYVYVDYGDCTGSNPESNHIIINTGTSLGIALNTPTSTSFCAGDTAAPLEANVQDASYSYTWYRDGTQVQAKQTGAFTYTIDTNDAAFAGDYTVKVEGPAGSGICTETSAPVSITNAGAFTVSRTNAANMVVLPGQTITLNVTTTANSPNYQWYRNTTAIPGSNNASLAISQAGTYYVAVSQTGGTCTATTINSETTEVISPNSFRFEIDYATAYESCASSSIVLEVDKIYAELTDGSEIDVTADSATNFTYQWKKGTTDVAGENAQSLSLTSNTDNGNYSVSGVSGSFNATSNTLPVQLGTSETLTITSTSAVYCSSSDSITLSTPTNLTGENFVWQRDGATANDTDTSLIVTQPGTYRLVIEKGICPLTSNEITIAPLNPDLITLDIDGDVIFPEGSSKTVNANGGTAYRWLNANSVEIATGPSITFTEEGNYLLIANIDNCEVSKPIQVTYLDLFNIPNVITPNGDGSNDQWVIPNSYSNKSDVRVIIYNAKGVEVLNSTNYQNSWPQSSTAFSAQNQVFYYVIKNASETLKQGTITVIR